MQKILSIMILVIVTFAFTSSALAAKNSQAEAYSNRCNAQIELADYQSAISDCTKAITLANNPTEALLSRSIAYYRQGNYHAAIIDSDRIIALHKCDFRAYYNRALAYPSFVTFGTLKSGTFCE